MIRHTHKSIKRGLKHAKILCCSPKPIDVRLEYALCAEEQSYVRKRRKYVASALKKVLQLQEELQDDEVRLAGFFSLPFLIFSVRLG